MEKHQDNPISEILRAHERNVNEFSLTADVDHSVIYQSLEGRYMRLPSCVRCGLEALGADTEGIERQHSAYHLSLRKRLPDRLYMKDAA